MGLFRRRGSGTPNAAAHALQPVAGVTVERYAELCAIMARANGDLEECARIAADEGLDRATWQQAMEGWNARMSDPATAGAVAMAYMPVYQETLARVGGPPATATLDEYIEMSAMINTDVGRPVDLDAMYARFGIDAPRWSQISTHWVGRLTSDPGLAARYGERTRARVAELDADWQAAR